MPIRQPSGQPHSLAGGAVALRDGPALPGAHPVPPLRAEMVCRRLFRDARQMDRYGLWRGRNAARGARVKSTAMAGERESGILFRSRSGQLVPWIRPGCRVRRFAGPRRRPPATAAERLAVRPMAFQSQRSRPLSVLVLIGAANHRPSSLYWTALGMCAYGNRGAQLAGSPSSTASSRARGLADSDRRARDLTVTAGTPPSARSPAPTRAAAARSSGNPGW